jgi:TnpA family transposase
VFWDKIQRIVISVNVCSYSTRALISPSSAHVWKNTFHYEILLYSPYFDGILCTSAIIIKFTRNLFEHRQYLSLYNVGKYMRSIFITFTFT